jgi:hypothetical protein
VFRGGDEHAFFHQAGGIADAGHVAADRFHLKSIKISAAKHDAGARSRGHNAHRNRGAAVQANAATRYRRSNCLLVFFQDWIDCELIEYRWERKPVCGKKATLRGISGRVLSS